MDPYWHALQQRLKQACEAKSMESRSCCAEGLMAELRLDERPSLLVGTVCLPKRNSILFPVNPDETQVYPRLRTVETLLFHDSKVPRANLAILPRTTRLQLLY